MRGKILHLHFWLAVLYAFEFKPRCSAAYGCRGHNSVRQHHPGRRGRPGTQGASKVCCCPPLMRIAHPAGVNLQLLDAPSFCLPLCLVCSDLANNKVLSAVDSASLDAQFEVFAL